MKIILILLVIIQFSIMGKPIEVGNDWPLISLKDQNDKPRDISPETNLVIFVAEMDPSKIVHEVLQSETEESLNKKKVIFVSDINKMPSLITRFIALPKMRGYSYPIALVREAGVTQDLPREKGRITLFILQKMKVKKIEYVNDKEELKKSILEAENVK
ncbi:MAG: hypothetical protein EBS19_12980 [Spirochaetia bacterium]|nr:hypothetical protein [Spirochaetia bacterium]